MDSEAQSFTFYQATGKKYVRRWGGGKKRDLLVLTNPPKVENITNLKMHLICLSCGTS
jgi:hypothetical protein